MNPFRRKAIWLAAMAAFYVQTPFLVGGHMTSVLVFAAVYAIMVTGLNVFMGYTWQISFGHNGFAAIGGYASAILTTSLNCPVPVAIFFGVCAAVCVSWVIGYPTLRLRGHYLAMATFAFGLITGELILQLKGLTQGSFGISNIPAFGIGSWQLRSDVDYYYTYWAIAALCLWIANRFSGMRFGRALRGLAGDEQATRALGIDVSRYKLASFMLSAGFAALGGALLAHYVTFISPEAFGVYLLLLLVTMLFAGGLGTRFGPVIGALAMLGGRSPTASDAPNWPY